LTARRREFYISVASIQEQLQRLILRIPAAEKMFFYCRVDQMTRTIHIVKPKINIRQEEGMSKALRMALVLVLLVAFAVSAQAQDTAKKHPIQLAIFTPIQLFPAQDNISGLRLSLLYTKNASVSGLDWGFVTRTTNMSKGVQTGFVSIADARFVGFQYSWVNVCKTDFEGFQWGIVNYAHYCNGFQLGLVNYAGKMKGLQVGLVNVIKQGGKFPVFPIVNWTF